MDVFQHQCEVEGEVYTKKDVYTKILGTYSGYVCGLGRAVKLAPSPTLTMQSFDL